MTCCFLTNEVWGKSYGELFLNHVLPNHLSPGNVPALARRFSCQYRIYTTAEDAAWMEMHPNIARLREFMPATFITLDPDAAALQNGTSGDKYAHYARYLRHAVVDALAAEAAILNLCPDAIFSDGAFACVADLASRGIRLVCLPGVRVERDPFLAEWGAVGPGDAATTNAARTLIPIALRHLHPVSQSLCWDASPFNDTWPSHLYWRLAENNGMLIRAFHLHAFYIDPADRTFVPQSTLDDDYIQHACPDPAQVHFVRDSDELVCFELSPPQQLAGQTTKGRPASVLRVSAWAAKNCRPRHLDAFRRPMIIHAGPLSGGQGSIFFRSAIIARCILFWTKILPAFSQRSTRHPLMNWLYKEVSLLKKTWRRFACLCHYLHDLAVVTHRAECVDKEPLEAGDLLKVKPLARDQLAMQKALDHARARLDALGQQLASAHSSGVSAVEIQQAIFKAMEYCYVASVPGSFAEFGTAAGITASHLAQAFKIFHDRYGYMDASHHLPERKLFLFDSFCGFPAINHQVDATSPHVASKVWAEGACKGLSAAQLRDLVAPLLSGKEFEIVPGFYKDSMARLDPEIHFALIHVDCDLYESTMDALSGLFARGQVAPGCVILFDDWNCNHASNAHGERKAWQELTEAFAIRHSSLGSYGCVGHRYIIHSYLPAKPAD